MANRFRAGVVIVNFAAVGGAVALACGSDSSNAPESGTAREAGTDSTLPSDAAPTPAGLAELREDATGIGLIQLNEAATADIGNIDVSVPFAVVGTGFFASYGGSAEYRRVIAARAAPLLEAAGVPSESLGQLAGCTRETVSGWSLLACAKAGPDGGGQDGGAIVGAGTVRMSSPKPFDVTFTENDAGLYAGEAFLLSRSGGQRVTVEGTGAEFSPFSTSLIVPPVLAGAQHPAGLDGGKTYPRDAAIAIQWSAIPDSLATVGLFIAGADDTNVYVATVSIPIANGSAEIPTALLSRLPAATYIVELVTHTSSIVAVGTNDLVVTATTTGSRADALWSMRLDP